MRINLWMTAGVVLALSSCATTWPLIGSSSVPAAEGSLRTSIEDNGNTRLRLSVHHLAQPGRVTPGATTFVVWVKGLAAGSRIQHLGALHVDSDLAGSLDAVTPLSEFQLTITAESSPSAPTPSGSTVLATTVKPGG